MISCKRWANQVAVVTGASSGIGAAIVHKLVGLNLKVVGLARRKEKLDQLSEELKHCEGKLYVVQTDVSKSDDVLKAFKWIEINVGPISILINNAGVLKPTSLVDGNIELWKATFDTNVLGLCIATREAVANMRINKIDGHIIHINSIAGHFVPQLDNLNVYPASKHAVTALTETLRRELSVMHSKIKITSISPGLVDTEIFAANELPFNKDSFGIKCLDSEDIAEAVVYVLSTPSHVQIHEMIIRPVGEPV